MARGGRCFAIQVAPRSYEHLLPTASASFISHETPIKAIKKEVGTGNMCQFAPSITPVIAQNSLTVGPGRCANGGFILFFLWWQCQEVFS